MKRSSKNVDSMLAEIEKAREGLIKLSKAIEDLKGILNR